MSDAPQLCLIRTLELRNVSSARLHLSESPETVFFFTQIIQLCICFSFFRKTTFPQKYICKFSRKKSWLARHAAREANELVSKVRN
jgi:hypothetical protein